jgi:hypothetical protein
MQLAKGDTLAISLRRAQTQLAETESQSVIPSPGGSCKMRRALPVFTRSLSQTKYIRALVPATL